MELYADWEALALIVIFLLYSFLLLASCEASFVLGSSSRVVPAVAAIRGFYDSHSPVQD